MSRREEAWPVIYPLPMVKRIKKRWITVEKVINKVEIEVLRKYAEEVGHEESDDPYRKSTMAHIGPQQHKWVYQRFANAMVEANNREWRLGVSGFYQPIAVVTYQKGGSIAAHTDYTPDSNTKLGIVVMLSRIGDFKGGELVFEDERQPEPLLPGDGIIFPGYELHRVNEITKGTRVVAAGWLQGPEWS